jgi:Spy/CpxP family protein refolding chaperone
MLKKRYMTILATIALATSATWAQPPDASYPGEERPRHDRWQGDRMTRIAEYLELSDSQATEWEAMTDQHLDTVRSQRSRIESLRDEFRSTADQANPDLEQLGRVALDLHREMEAARSSRGQLQAELVTILTPEQAERYEALAAARKIAGPDGHHGRREGRTPADSK